MTGDDITLGEAVRLMEALGRRVDDVVRRLEEAARAGAEREARFESLFLPRREFELSQQADAIEMRGLTAEVHKVGKQQDACEAQRRADAIQWDQRRKEDQLASDARWKEATDRRRADRTLVLSALVFPILVAIITAALLAQGGIG